MRVIASEAPPLSFDDRWSIDQADPVASARVARKGSVEGPYLGVQSFGKREIRSVICRMPFELDGYLYGTSVVRSEIESHVESIEDCEGL